MGVFLVKCFFSSLFTCCCCLEMYVINALFLHTVEERDLFRPHSSIEPRELGLLFRIVQSLILDKQLFDNSRSL